jgi:CRP/FNR family transcriptional regulator, cyclic AMP receptor protein
MTATYDRVEALQASPLFNDLLPIEKQYLADLAVHRSLGAGDVLFEAGDLGDAMYVVVSGELGIEGGEGGASREVAELVSPDFVGEMALIDKQPRAARVRAKSDATLLAISHANIYSFARVHRSGFTWLVVNIAKNLASRLRSMNEAALGVAE